MTQHTSIWAALAAAHADFKPLMKSGTNPHFRSKYSTLTDVLNAVRTPLLTHGVVIYQAPAMLPKEPPHDNEFVFGLRSTLYHVDSDTQIEDAMPLPNDPNPQKMGSAISYAKRYMLVAQCSLADGLDDDAHVATNGTDKPQATQKPQPAQPVDVQVNGPEEATDAAEGNPFDDVPENVRKAYHATGTKLHGKSWTKARHEQVVAISKGERSSSKELTEAEMKRLTAGMAAKLSQEEVQG